MGIIENVIVQVNCLPIGECCITMKHVQQQCDANKCRCILFQKTTWIFRRFCWLFYLCWIYIVRIVYILLVLLLLTGSLSGHLRLSKDKMQRTILKFKSSTVQKKTLKTGSNIKGLPETPSDTILNKNEVVRVLIDFKKSSNWSDLKTQPQRWFGQLTMSSFIDVR